MNKLLLGRVVMVAAALGIFGAAGASARAPETETSLAAKVGHALRMDPQLTIWDDVSVRVNGGEVELSGVVNQPYRRQEIERRVADVPGVAGVDNQIRVLPLSPNDDRLRLQVARAIYGDPVLGRYGIEPVPPIHIIVENGRVTLAGVVNNTMEKQLAGMRAAGAMSFGPVINNLTVERSPAKRG